MIGLFTTRTWACITKKLLPHSKAEIFLRKEHSTRQRLLPYMLRARINSFVWTDNVMSYSPQNNNVVGGSESVRSN